MVKRYQKMEETDEVNVLYDILYCNVFMFHY